MGEFFKGRKRKLGVVTLLLALVFTAGWVRSVVTAATPFRPNLIAFSPATYEVKDGDFVGIGTERQSLTWWEFDTYDVDDPTGHIGNTTAPVIVFAIPFWSIILPLTLVSAFLLLSKPRKSSQTKPIEPIAEKAE